MQLPLGIVVEELHEITIIVEGKRLMIYNKLSMLEY